SNDASQVRVPAMSFPDTPVTDVPGMPTTPMSAIPSTPSAGVPTIPFPRVPTTPPASLPTIPFPRVAVTPSLPGIQPVVVDPRIRERVTQCAQWLQINNNLPVSPEKTQVFREVALEITKVGKREIRTFAPVQERTSAVLV